MGVNILCGILDKNAKLGVVDALLLALIGIVIVFVVLIALMLLVTLVGKIFDGSEKLQKEHPEWGEKLASCKAKLMFWKKEKPEEQAQPAEEAPKELAKGTCGELVLINCEERDAAMIMAIVADSLKTPLNELRFKSIKRVEE